MNSHEYAERLVYAQNKITGWREKAHSIAHNLPVEYGEIYDKNERQYISLILEVALASDEEIANGSTILDGVKDAYEDLTDSYLPGQVTAFKAEVIATDSSAASIPLFYVARILKGEVILREGEELRQQEGKRRREEEELKRQAEERERQEKERQRQIEQEQHKENTSTAIKFCILLGISCIGLIDGSIAAPWLFLWGFIGLFFASNLGGKLFALWIICHVAIQIFSMTTNWK